MPESIIQNFNHLKIHSQYSICEGAVKIDDLKDFYKKNNIRALGLSDTSNLCGALEFSEKISKIGVQPIIGTQINFKFNDTIGLIPLYALNENGYKRIIELSSLSYLNNNQNNEPYLIFDELLKSNDGITWHILNTGITNSLNSIAYGNEIFIAVGDSGTIIRSEDEENWTKVNIESGYNKIINDIVYGNNMFVAVGGFGAILVSKNNGISWEEYSVGNLNSLKNISYKEDI